MALNSSYDLNDRVRCTGTFTVSDVNTDPTAITFVYKVPSGTITTLTYGVDGALVKSATGVYYVDLDVSSAGSWYYVFRGTGACVAAVEGKFFVKVSDVV